MYKQLGGTLGLNVEEVSDLLTPVHYASSVFYSILHKNQNWFQSLFEQQKYTHCNTRNVTQALGHPT